MLHVREAGGEATYETWRSFRRARRAGLGVSCGTLRASCPACWGQGHIHESIEQADLDGWRPDDVQAVVAWVPVMCETCRGTGRA